MTSFFNSRFFDISIFLILISIKQEPDNHSLFQNTDYLMLSFVYLSL